MTQTTERVRVGEFLKYAMHPDVCLDYMTLKAATVQSIVPGACLEDSTGLIICLIDEVADVSAIALESIEATGGEKILCLVRGPAVVDSDKLTFDEGVTWADVAAYFAALGIYPAQSALAVWDTQTF